MNDAITTKNYRKLSLQIGPGGMSFCIFDTLNWEIVSLKHNSFSKHLPLEDELWRVFVEHPELKNDYDEVMVLHDNSFNAFVPNVLFDENYPGSYLQYNTRVFEADFFAWDILPVYAMTNVYVPLINVNNFLLERLGSFEYKNTNSILVEKLLDASVNIDEKLVYAHIQASHFEIVVTHNQKLLLFNSFEYSTPEDFLYYLLFTMEQLNLNPETAKILLLGAITETDPRFKIAYNYIRNISIYEPEGPVLKWNADRQEALHNFILFNS
ncbi:DUF3822 family protein [Flavobacterium sp. Sd200]|uniref:DUF3822 family protein n=1 Tax=Flavobacterium sp. Sd200 TaxID=2692211 RepID=UPI00136B5D27|nr:DUF3822 family protein [Flavobacterium sp. Sd200]MXN89901.1 DUF3822 family protein [Flavobacterium sp. Sd200]